ALHDDLEVHAIVKIVMSQEIKFNKS
ncbi:MAG: hypothetical protein RLZZ172_2561, partial [Bacteroidota bacterium]